ncbi:unnamed protein product [Dibothriocephalus latus]|uniref:RRM domain-containing protein n=1 Tax=Dibothriocephalus latus TaxID=60516 RepID=A0A3P7KZT5_DIBLA|nr:unnamed protein product [Dibothriocephalus latus]
MQWDVDPKTIFIRLLPDSVKDFHLHEYFSKFGVIRYIHVSEWHDSRRRAFITFRDLDSVREVLEIHPHLLNETPINVYLAIIKRSSDNGGITPGVAECNSGDDIPASLGTKKADSSATELDSNHPSIYVGHLTPRITESDLKAYFSNFGLVTDVQIMNDRFTGESRGFGFVSFADIGAAESVLESCHFLKECRLIVKPSKRRRNVRDSSVQPTAVVYLDVYLRRYLIMLTTCKTKL